MPKTKIKGSYNPESLEKALDESRNGGKIREIARKYRIPKSTLHFKLKRPDRKSTFGPSPYLTNREETCLENRVLQLSKKEFPLKKEDLQSTLDTSYEAMDIDQSQNSVRDISNDDVQLIDTVGFDKLSSKTTVNSSLKPIKRFYLNFQNLRNKFSKFNIFAILVAVCAVFIYISMSLECCDMLDLHRIDEDLKTKLYGQSVAIKSIIAAFSSKIPIKILFFYGGTGVGKTYTSSLIFNRLCQCSNIYHYTGPTFWHTYSNNLMFGYSLCKSSIIIIDDLMFDDAEFPYHIKAIIEKSQNLNKNLTIILLYNSDAPKEGFVKYKDLVFGKNLMAIYSHIEVQKYFIQFKEITSDTLQKCIENELNGKNISNVLMKNIIQIFNASSDGCKNVYSKLKYLNLS